MFVQTIRRNQEIILLSVIYFVLNFMDGSLTLWGLNLGIIEEANPLMRSLIFTSPILFGAVKLSLPILVAFYCWFIRKKNLWLAVFVLWLAIAVYSLVTLAHGYWLVKALA
jgi:hypothetical protein